MNGFDNLLKKSAIKVMFIKVQLVINVITCHTRTAMQLKKPT